MPDIGIIWDAANGRGDWARAGDVPAGADDGTGGDLTAAVLVSLFTDRRAPTDFVPTDGTNDWRGFWGDAYEPVPIGSWLWLLDRAKRTTATLLQARDYCVEALAWLLTDQVASAVEVETFWAGRTALGIAITITRAQGPGVLIETSLPWGTA